MFGSINLGQYIPAQSTLHRLDPRSKILAGLLLIMVVFAASFPWELLPLYLVSLGLLYISRLRIIDFALAIKPFLIIIIITIIVQILFIPGKSLLEFYFINISYEGLQTAISFILRFILLLFIVRLLTATTTPIALMDGLETMLNPLKKMGLAIHELIMIMTISLRFIPLFIEEAERIRKAQLCRGADFRVGKLSHRLKNLIAWLLPLMRISLQRAEELSQAMEARAYHGGEGRTRLSTLQLTFTDYAYVLSMAALLLIVLIV